MKCGYCLVEFHAQSQDGVFGFTHDPKLPDSPERDPNLFFHWSTYVCSKCRGPHIFLKVGRFVGPTKTTYLQYRQIQPRGGSFPPPPSEVPASIAADYAEANEVLSVSPKASAALSRRCLQAILAAHGYKGRDLVKQVEAVLVETDASKALPTPLQDNIDAIRNFGNFSAHPITDQTTLQVVNVEEGEAEWCLQLLLDLFDFYYVAPIRAAEKRAALSAKLTAAGKPPMKQGTP